MSTRMLEFQLYGFIEDFLKRKGFKTSREVRPYDSSSRRVDVVGIRPRNKEVVVVEAKLSNYLGVMKQAMAGLFISDYVYISVPYGYSKTVIKKHEDELKDLGIGLLAVNGKAIELLSPEMSKYTDPVRKQKLIDIVVDMRKYNE